jgi:hypothetical protein
MRFVCPQGSRLLRLAAAVLPVTGHQPKAALTAAAWFLLVRVTDRHCRHPPHPVASASRALAPKTAQPPKPSASIVSTTHPEAIKGKRVVVLEDGPTLTHGGMPTGAGYVAALEYGAAEVVDPRPYLVGELADTARRYPHLGPVLPAMGYSARQVRLKGGPTLDERGGRCLPWRCGRERCQQGGAGRRRRLRGAPGWS